MDHESRRIQRLLGKIALQLPAHQVKECRVAIARQGTLGTYVQRCAAGFGKLRGIDQTGVVELAQHEIAPFSRVLRRAPGIEFAGPAHHAHQQGNFGRVELGHLAPEIEFGGSGKSVHGLATLLAEEYLVDVGLKNAALVVAVLDDQRNQGFVELAHEAAAAIKEQVLDQLLGERRPALHHATGAQVYPARAQDRAQVDAVVMLELAILDSLQAGQQQGWQLFKLNHAPFFLLHPVQGGDAGRIQFRLRQRLATAGIHQRGDLSVTDVQGNAALGMPAIEAVECAAGNDEMAAILTEGARRLRAAVLAVARGIQLKQQGVERHRPADGEIKGPRQHAARYLPAQVIEARAHLAIELDHIGDKESRQRAKRKPNRSAQPAPEKCQEGKQSSDQVQGAARVE